MLPYKAKLNGKWIYDTLKDLYSLPIDENTICTPVYDWYNDKIYYTGDIVEYVDAAFENEVYRGILIFDERDYCVKIFTRKTDAVNISFIDCQLLDEIKVLNNIYDCDLEEYFIPEEDYDIKDVEYGNYYCPECGVLLTKEQTFCDRCGTFFPFDIKTSEQLIIH